jgi:hypothetical protein
MRSFDTCTMAVGLLERLGVLALACSKQSLHPLSWLQGQGTSALSGAGRSGRAGLTIHLGELHLDDGLAFGMLAQASSSN